MAVKEIANTEKRVTKMIASTELPPRHDRFAVFMPAVLSFPYENQKFFLISYTLPKRLSYTFA